MNYVRLKRGNDWGTEYYYHPDRPKTPFGTYQASSGIAFTEGQTVRVRWPDGSGTEEVVRMKKKHTQVGDHGHTYDVSYGLPGIETTNRGVTTWVPLDEVDLLLPSPPNGDGSLEKP